MVRFGSVAPCRPMQLRKVDWWFTERNAVGSRFARRSWSSGRVSGVCQFSFSFLIRWLSSTFATANRYMQFIAIICLAVGAAIFYGIVHDQITAHICVEYF